MKDRLFVSMILVFAVVAPILLILGATSTYIAHGPADHEQDASFLARSLGSKRAHLRDHPHHAVQRGTLNYAREYAMSRSRKALHASSCETAMYSSALCAWSIEPGPMTTVGMPARANRPASVP